MSKEPDFGFLATLYHTLSMISGVMRGLEYFWLASGIIFLTTSAIPSFGISWWVGSIFLLLWFVFREVRIRLILNWLQEYKKKIPDEYLNPPIPANAEMAE